MTEGEIPQQFIVAARKALQCEPTRKHKTLKIEGLPVFVESVARALMAEHENTLRDISRAPRRPNLTVKPLRLARVVPPSQHEEILVNRPEPK